MLPTRDSLKTLGHTETESKGIEKDIPCKQKPKESWSSSAILISNKINFKTKTEIRDKEGCYIIIKGASQQEDLIFVNIYAHNIPTPKYIKQI